VCLLAAAPVAAQSTVDPTLPVDTLVTGLALPTTMAFVAPNDLLVLEKNTGRVRRVLAGSLLNDPVLTVAVDTTSERGLLGIAVNTESPPGVFLYYTQASPLRNVVMRYDWNAGLGLLESPALVLDLPATPGPNHAGGIVVLGPPGEAPGVGDGALLYAVIGDLNRSNQLENVAAGGGPDDTAVILRVRQDGTAAPGNPFSAPGFERYFAYGIRNSFGLALDPISGFLWDTENGPSIMDEVNRVPAGFNSGWRPIMGPDSRDPQGTGDLFDTPGSAYRDPEFSWLDTVAPTAIVFPAGSRLGAGYDAVALVGDNNNGFLYRFPLDATRSGFDLITLPGLGDRVADSSAELDLVVWGSGFGAVTDLEIGPDGRLYVVSLTNGAIYRVSGPPLPVSIPGWSVGLLALLLLSIGLLWRTLGGEQVTSAA
jgi:glucose/arabinose dehydrogenase